MRSANQRNRPIRGGLVSGHRRSLTQSPCGIARNRTVAKKSVPTGPGRRGGSGPACQDCGALWAQALEFRSRRLGAAGPSGTARTHLCLESISARGVCCESPASPPARSRSHLPERKSACSSGPGGTCSEEWRCRVRRCAWLDLGAPRQARLSPWVVAREKLVLGTREPARRDPLPLWGRGMSSGFPGSRV